MCTSFTLESQDGNFMLSRTMDFSIEMAKTVVYIPKNFSLSHCYKSIESYKTKYSYVGMGELKNNISIIFDGVNDHGLCGATLYFAGYAKYVDPEIKTNSVKISPDMVINYILGNYSTIDQVKEAFIKHQIEIVNECNPTLKIVPPLHYIFMDNSGKTIIIETTKDGINVYDQNVGVMTNSPEYPWHENNLNNYLTLTPKQHKEVKWLGKTLRPISQGSGNFGLPGDFTSVSRFIRAAFLKNFMPQGKNELDNLLKAEHILKSVNVAKGAVVTEENNFDYSCYRAFMSSTSRTYYFATYGNQRIRKIDLKKLESNLDPKVFTINNEEDILDITEM